MQVRIQKWGDGLALPIPDSFAAGAQISQDELVELSLVNGNLVISPVAQAGTTLDDLLRRITPENLRAEIGHQCSAERSL